MAAAAATAAGSVVAGGEQKDATSEKKTDATTTNKITSTKPKTRDGADHPVAPTKAVLPEDEGLGLDGTYEDEEHRPPSILKWCSIPASGKAPVSCLQNDLADQLCKLPELFEEDRRKKAAVVGSGTLTRQQEEQEQQESVEVPLCPGPEWIRLREKKAKSHAGCILRDRDQSLNKQLNTILYDNRELFAEIVDPAATSGVPADDLDTAITITMQWWWRQEGRLTRKVRT